MHLCANQCQESFRSRKRRSAPTAASETLTSPSTPRRRLSGDSRSGTGGRPSAHDMSGDLQTPRNVLEDVPCLISCSARHQFQHFWSLQFPPPATWAWFQSCRLCTQTCMFQKQKSATLHVGVTGFEPPTGEFWSLDSRG